MLNLNCLYDRDGNVSLSLGDTFTINDKHPVDPNLTMEVVEIHEWCKGTLAVYGLTTDGRKLGPFNPEDVVWDIE